MQTWHGQKVNDPYFWLREKGTAPVEDYLKAENAYTEAMTQAQKPLEETLYKEMLGRIKQTDLSVPTLDRGYWYYSRTEEGKQYGIQCRRKGDMNAPEEVLLDLNEMGKGLKFISLGGMDVSPDNQRMVYLTDTSGFRQYRLFVTELATGRILPDTAERVTSTAWAADSKTLFYVTEDPVTKRSNQLWRLELGGKPELVFEEKDELFGVGLGETKDHRYLALTLGSTDTWETLLLPSDQPKGAFKTVLGREKGHKYTVDHREGLFYIRTNRDARNFRIVTAPVNDPKQWKEFVPAKADVLVEGLDLFKDHAVVIEKHQGLSRFRILDFKTRKWHDVTFPESVYAASPAHTPEFNTHVWRFSYQSMVTPSTVYDYDFATHERKLLKRQEVLGGYDPANYATERLWATARDGVKVPISIVYRKGLKRNGTAPLYLYGYGSYGAGMSATFSIGRLSLLDRGVAYAVAHIRGGNELGEPWHDDGMLMKKKNTFFDFIDCAEYLIKEKWTAKDRIVAEGGSAGGLLMGAVVNFRPDLFKAVHAAVPFVDVMNTMMDASLPLTVGEYLEWGNPNEKPAFDYMMSYSPYDNLKKGAYPAILVTTSYNDSQVMYWEPAKYVAKLRSLKTDTNPLVFKCKMDPAGHGGASGRYDRLKDVAFDYAWMLNQLGITK
ncbi:MAG: S9 family peptidase [Firmicutes bacterium]|nr:S9 family peptidase [Bacillota bacterium]